VVTAEKIKVYPDDRIAGTSGNVERITISQEFAFDGFTIIVDNVWAYRDKDTGKQYVPGGLAMFLSDAVQELAVAIQRDRAERHEPLPSLWSKIRLTAPQLPGMAT